MTDAQQLETPPSQSRSRSLKAIVAILFSLGYLAILCATAYPTVFPEGRPARLAGPDAYFHLRHTETILENFPVISRFDPMTNFPNGEVGLNQGFFDLSVAIISKLSLGLLSPKAILLVISPLCALVVALWCAHWLSREVGDVAAGGFLLLSLAYPGPLNTIAALGQGDHHVFELLLAVAIAWSLKRLFEPATSWKTAPLAALPLLWLYFSWPGAPLHLLLVGAVFYFRAWNPEISDRQLALKGSLYGLTLTLVVGVMDWAVPWSTIWNTSKTIFWPAGLCLFLGYPLLVGLADRARRFPSLGAFSILALALGLAWQYPTTQNYLLALGGERSSAIAEHVPLSVSLLNLWYGPTWPLAIAGVALLVWRRKLWWANLALIYGGGLVAFWLTTKDFVYYAPPVIAAAAAYALTCWKWPRGFALILPALVAPALFLPNRVQLPWMTPAVAQDSMMVSDGLESASAWLRAVHDSRESGEEYGLVAPWDLGNILAQTAAVPVGWSQTHDPRLSQIFFTDRVDVAYRVLTEQSKPFRYIYLPARNLSEKYLTELELAGIPIGAEFTVSEIPYNNASVPVLKPLPRYHQTLVNRLYWKKGEGLGQYRMVYETAEQSLHTQKLYPEAQSIELHSRPVNPKAIEGLKPLLDFPNTPLPTSRGLMAKGRLAPEVRLFELVAGATVQGEAPPNSDVTAELRLSSPASGKSWVISWSAQADSKGKWELRLPYPTDRPLALAPGTITVEGKYRLTTTKKVLTFSLSESMIQSGSTLQVGGEKKL